MKYVLYNEDVAAASFDVEQSRVTSFKGIVPELLPMQLKDASPDRFMMWLRDRSIDLNVLQHRNLAQEMYGTRDKLMLALKTNMFSLTDTFTCFPEDEYTPRGSLFAPDGQNQVSEYILLSSDTSVNNAHISSPNMSTDGSFTKTWVYEDGEWWLYKIQSSEATRGEVSISRVLKNCNWDAAEYKYVGSYRKRVKSRNFLGAHEFFEPYDSLRYMFKDTGDDDETIFRNIASLGDEFRSAWKKILIADALFLNTDRHMRNFGVIRSSETGAILRLAPNFDNNQAFKANPSGRYSDSMLSLYMKNADQEDYHNLQILMDCSGNEKYLAEASVAATAFCRGY